MHEIVITQTFKRELERIGKDHLKRILQLLEKLRKEGKNALKILDVEGKFILGELKSKKPPYRLYIYVDQENDVYYVVSWEHKKVQKKIITKLKEKLRLALFTSLEEIFKS